MKKIFKRTIKKIINIFGYEIYPKNIKCGIQGLSEFLTRISKLGFRPKTIFDVGAAYGTFPLYEAFPYAKHILIEPLKEFENYLKDITIEYNAEYLIAAAGTKTKSEKIKINIHKDLVGSSIFKETEGLNSQLDGYSREVSMVVIDDLCNDKNLMGPYLIKIDTQGAELIVLDGISSKILEETEIIILEVSFFQFFVGGPQFYEVIKYMKERSFIVYDIIGSNYRPYDGALAQIDLAFVREDGQFRKNHCYATKKQRKELISNLLKNPPKE